MAALQEAGKINCFNCQAGHVNKKTADIAPPSAIVFQKSEISNFKFRIANRSIPIGILQDSAWLGKSLPRFAVALGAQFRGRHHIIRLKAAGTALELEHRNSTVRRVKRVKSSKMPMRLKAIH
jgi:hypothetical protein